MEKLLEVKNLKKLFPVKAGLFKRTVAHVHAVEDVSFDIHERETFGLVGESGCGKTTIGKLILQLQKADSGEILYKGEDLNRLPKKELQKKRSEIQIVFQDPYGSLNPKMQVGSILAEGIKKHHLLPPEQIPARVAELLLLVGLHESDAQKYPHEFSGGQRQRIVVAKALSFNPKLIVCDEPVSALDVSVQAQVLNLLLELRASLGLTYLFISHDLNVVSYLSDRVGVMYLGNLIELGTNEEIVKTPLHPYTQALFSAAQGGVLSGELPSPADPPGGCPFHTRCPECTERCKSETPPAKDMGGARMVRCFQR